MALPLNSSFTLHPSVNQMDNTGAVPPQVLQMRQQDEHNEIRFIKRRLFHETSSSAVGVRVTPFEPLVHRRNLPTSGPICSSHFHSNPQQASTLHPHYRQYPNRYLTTTTTGTQDEWQRAAFEPPITSTRDLHKRRCIQLHYAYNHSRQQMREMKEDQRQMKARIAELEDQLLRAQSGNRNRSFTDTGSMSSQSTIKARSSSSDLHLVESSLLASAVAAVTRQESPEKELEEQKPPTVVTIRKGGGVRLFFTDSEALSEDEDGDDEDIVEDDEDEFEIEDSSSYRKRKRTLTPRTGWQQEHVQPLHEEDRAAFSVPSPPQDTSMDMVSRAVSVAEEATNIDMEQAPFQEKKQKLA